jgi:hypothetical protein
MQVDYQLTEEDLIAFSQFQADHLSGFWGGPRMYLATGGIVFMLAIVITYLTEPQANLAEQLRIAMAFLFSGLLISVYIFRHRLIARSIRGRLSDKGFADGIPRERLEITAESITRSTAKTTTTTLWKGVENIMLTEDYARHLQSDRKDCFRAPFACLPRQGRIHEVCR